MKHSAPLRAGPLGVTLISAFVWATRPAEPSLATVGLIAIPFSVDAVRVPGVSAAELLIYEPREAPRPTQVTRVQVLAGGLLLR